MHNHDDKYPNRPGFEPGTSRLQAPVDTNEPSGPAVKGGCLGKDIIIYMWVQYRSHSEPADPDRNEDYPQNVMARDRSRS